MLVSKKGVKTKLYQYKISVQNEWGPWFDSAYPNFLKQITFFGLNQGYNIEVGK